MGWINVVDQSLCIFCLACLCLQHGVRPHLGPPHSSGLHAISLVNGVQCFLGTELRSSQVWRMPPLLCSAF